MILPLKRGRSFFLSFSLEATLTLTLVYLVGRLTLAIAPVASESFSLLLALNASLPLSASVTLARQTRRRYRGSLGQEVALVSMLMVLMIGAALTALHVFGDAPGAFITTLIMLESAIVVPIAAYGWRRVAAILRVPGFAPERILVLGSGDFARQLCEYIAGTQSDDFRVCGVVAPDGENSFPGASLYGPLLAPADLGSIRRSAVDRVVVALKERRGTLPFRELLALRLNGIPVEDSTSFVERTSGKLHVPSLRPSWLIFSEGFRVSRIRSLIKRGSDVLLSLTLLIAAAPLMLLTAIAIKLDSPGPVLYRQERVGLGGRRFQISKFRSMAVDAEKNTGPAWCVEGDPRVTRVGSWIRRLRIDELPQIWDVLVGNMSFIGPRPERPFFVEKLEREIPFYSLRAAVRPGLTGWAQVEYRYGASTNDALEKLKYDLFYVKNGNPLLDLWICVKTVGVVLTTTGAR